jgi:hypothetical protein
MSSSKESGKSPLPEGVNAYQGMGALTVIGVLGGCTFSVALAAPLPVLGTLAAGGGLMYFGHRANADDSDKPETPLLGN